MLKKYNQFESRGVAMLNKGIAITGAQSLKHHVNASLSWHHA
jgi:hypothetical protein